MNRLLLSDDFVAADHFDRGMDFHHRNLFAEALAEYDQVLRLTPDDRYAHWNRAMTLLSLGQYEEGFKEHEWAWKLFDWRGFGPVQGDMDRLSKLPMWESEDLSDKHLLIYHELGFGDAIQTMRYLPELKRRAASVTLIINSELVRLAQQFDLEVIDHVPADLSRFDYRMPFFGVMRALRQTLQNIPDAPYIGLRISPSLVSEPKRPRVGLCWSGRTQKMFTLDYFLSMFSHQAFELYSLQPTSTYSDQIHSLASGDFLDTSELISGLDHVITVDSAVAHLAGAMGHPSTHLLLPYQMDWRWWYSQAWYPKIKTYRQETADGWLLPFARLNAAMSKVKELELDD